MTQLSAQTVLVTGANADTARPRHELEVNLFQPRGVQVVDVYMGHVDTDMTAGVEAPKTAPEDVVRQVRDGVEPGDLEVMAGDLTLAARSGVHLPVAERYADLLRGPTRADCTTVGVPRRDLDNWDPPIVDAIAQDRHVIAFYTIEVSSFAASSSSTRRSRRSQRPSSATGPQRFTCRSPYNGTSRKES